MNAVLEAARRIVAWDDSGRLADDEWLVERNETAIIAICRALLSTSAAVRGMRWQPIEAAPRDGADVLAGFNRRRPTVAWFDGEDWLSSDSDDLLPDPIKWMSLAALSLIEGEDEQARPSGSAPISTDTKGTTK